MSDAVRLAKTNYPKILQARAEVTAARAGVTVQKIKEYNPKSLLSYEEVVATHNKLTQIVFADEVLPANPGPGFSSVSMNPRFFSGTGFILDWDPIDFGLHKARISLSKAELNLTQAGYGVTLLDVAVEAGSSYLDSLVAREQVKVAEANVSRFLEFSKVAHAQVDAGLQPGADASLADAQLANARNDLIRARLAEELALAALANALGLGGQLVAIDPGGMITVTEPTDEQTRFVPFFENHPLAVAGKAAIARVAAQKRVLDKEYYPRFRWLGGVNLRGSNLNTSGRVQSANVHGLFPVVPNWNIGLIVDLPFLDIIRIQAEKKVQLAKLSAERHAYDLIIQNLRTQDVQARARVKAAVELAANMPVQVEAGLAAARQAQARYEAGLATVAQVAQANEILADSRVKEAVANVGVWRALLAVASVHGDLRPFLDEAERATARGRQ